MQQKQLLHKNDKNSTLKLAVHNRALTLACAGLSLLLTANLVALPAHAVLPTFTQIASTGTNGFTAFGYYPAINDSGVVAFTATTGQSFLGASVYTGNGSIISTIASDLSLSAVTTVSINSTGNVAFQTCVVNTVQCSIFVGDTQGITPVASTPPFYYFTEIWASNSGGAIFGAFSLCNGGGVSGIFQADGVNLSILAGLGFTIPGEANCLSANNGIVGVESLGSVSSNGLIVYKGVGASGNGIYAGITPPLPISLDGDIDPFTIYFKPSINSGGTVAMIRQSGGTASSIVYGNGGPLTTFASNINGAFSYFTNVSINNGNVIAFVAQTPYSYYGIFVGPNPLIDTVIKTGDPLFGSTVGSVFYGPQGLNNNNQVAFIADLTDGRRVVARADLSFPPAPTLTSFQPSSATGGATVTLTGTNFTNTRAVQFNGVNATSYTAISPTQITAVVPENATTGPITVTTLGGVVTSSTSFKALPNVNSFSPTSGIANTSVFIDGTNFLETTSVKFNNANASSFTVNSATSITATVPSSATSGPITVTAPSGSVTSTATFKAVPKINSFSPTAGIANSSVVITGTNFLGTTLVRFNTTATTNFTVNSATQITAKVPSTATSGPVTVTTPGGASTSTTNFRVLPKINSFTPTSGPVGTAVTLTGSGFTGATSVQFNGVAATFTVTSATRITATVPVGATTGKIRVTTPTGSSTSTNSFTVQ